MDVPELTPDEVADSPLACERATFLGRFQPLHRGHHRVIDAYAPVFDEFVVALGSPGKARTAENPLDAAEREALVAACFPALEVVRVADEDRGEAGYPTWARRLVDATGATVVLSGNELVQRLVLEHTDADLVQQELHAPERFSGTEVRRRIRAGEPWRDLVPECCVDLVADAVESIRESGEAGE